MAPPTSSLLQNVAPRLLSRDLGQTVEKATGIHDWDSCMAHGYCKWPVIIGIIVLSLIILSIIFCVVKCCGCCVNCLSCCCGGSGHGKTKYVQAPQPQAPPMYPPAGYGFQPHMAYGAGAGPAPQFATFESSKSPSKIHADSLPAMPSWDTARSRKVEDTSEPPEEETKPLRSADDHGHGEDIAMEKLSPSGRSPQSPPAANYSRGEGYNQSQYNGHDANPGAGVGMAYGNGYNDHDHHNQGYDDHNSYGQQAQGYGQHQQGYDQQRGYGRGDQGYGPQANGYGPEGYGAGYGGYQSQRPGQRHPSQRPGQRPPGQRSPNPYGQDAGNPYGPRSPMSPADSTAYPPPSYQTQPPSRAYTPQDGLDRYGSQNSRYATSSDYASTVGYQGGFSQQQHQQPRHEENYSSPTVAEMPATRMSRNAPPAAAPSQYPQELENSGAQRPSNQMPASLQPGGGSSAWRSAGQRGGFDRKPVTGSWREV